MFTSYIILDGASFHCKKKNKRDALLSKARIALMQLLLYAHNVEAVTGLNFYIAETTYFQRRVFFYLTPVHGLFTALCKKVDTYSLSSLILGLTLLLPIL